eukprot:4373361-Lingulodinium_polyedra.AAC.1
MASRPLLALLGLGATALTAWRRAVRLARATARLVAAAMGASGAVLLAWAPSLGLVGLAVAFGLLMRE